MASDPPKLQRLAAVPGVFTPGAPIHSIDLFAGRIHVIRDVINIVAQPGQHVVLYGERGVGKTSLANILPEIASRVGRKGDLASVRVNCSSSDTYATVWRTVFKRTGVDPALYEQDLDPEAVRDVLESSDKRHLVVIDELDRLDDDEGLSLLADTVKSLSDHAVPATVVLVGVADSIDELVGDHRSVERALVQIKMLRMSRDELIEILDRGIARLGLEIDPVAKTRIAALSEGLPHYAHLLALHATQSAIMDDRARVGASDVDAATTVAVEKVQQSILGDYLKATRSPRRDHLFAEVLLACALARKDELGFFSASNVREPMSRIMGRVYEIPAFARHLNEFSNAGRGPVLEKQGEPRRYFYRFANPILQPYVILHGLSRGLLEESVLDELRRGRDR